MVRIAGFMILLGGAWLARPVAWAADQEPRARDRVPSPAPAELIRQLADSRFAIRNQAMSQLIAAGVDAIAVLEQGIQSPDREVSFRSRRALEAIRAHDFQRRLQVFAVGRDADERYELPGWALFRKQVGDGLEARRLFVDMQQAEPDLLVALEVSPERACQALADRLEKFQLEGRGGQNPRLTLGTIMTFLFIGIQPSGDTMQPALQNLSTFFRQDVFASAMQVGPQRDILGKMLGLWIENARSWEGFHAMLLAMQYELPQGLAPAQRLLESEVSDANQAVYRGFALQTFARFGDTSHIPIVEPLLDDASPYGGSLNVSGNAKYQTQVRDIALATLVHLAKENPQRFGLTRIKPSSSQVFNPNSVAFEDDAQREKAIETWRAFRVANQP